MHVQPTKSYYSTAARASASASGVVGKHKARHEAQPQKQKAWEAMRRLHINTEGLSTEPEVRACDGRVAIVISGL